MERSFTKGLLIQSQAIFMAPENSSDDRDESMVYDELSTVEEKCQEYISLYRSGDAPSFAQFAAQI